MYRGVVGYCTGCGKARPPLVTSSVSLAGQGARVGGVVAKSAGWIVTALGLFLTTIFAGISALAFGGAAITWILLILGLGFTGLFGGVLMASGKKLASSGTDAQRFAREKALVALAGNKGGTITPLDASRSLDIPLAEASAFLTDMAKRVPDEVTMDLDDEGGLLYTFVHAKVARMPSGGPEYGVPPSRVSGAPEAGERVRVDDAVSPAGAYAPSAYGAPQEPIDAEFTQDTPEARKSRG